MNRLEQITFIFKEFKLYKLKTKTKKKTIYLSLSKNVQMP